MRHLAACRTEVCKLATEVFFGGWNFAGGASQAERARPRQGFGATPSLAAGIGKFGLPPFAFYISRKSARCLTLGAQAQ